MVEIIQNIVKTLSIIVFVAFLFFLFFDISKWKTGWITKEDKKEIKIQEKKSLFLLFAMIILWILGLFLQWIS